jgi:alanyl-tRNA synthetase
VEFVAGLRAVASARRDFATLTETAVLFSAHIYDVPQQAQKSLEEIKALRKQREQSLEELAAAQAAALLSATASENGGKLVLHIFSDRDMSFLKLFAQKLTRLEASTVALLGTTSPQPALVFAQCSGQNNDMGALMKEIAGRFGGRGGGSKDMAQGGIADSSQVEAALADARASVEKTTKA